MKNRKKIQSCCWLVAGLLTWGMTQRTIAQLAGTPEGVSQNGEQFQVPQQLQDPFDGNQKDPYTGKPLNPIKKATIGFDQTVEIPVPLHSLDLVQLKTPEGKPIAPQQIYLSDPRDFAVSVQYQSTMQTILIRYTNPDPTPLPGTDPNNGPSVGVIKSGYAFVETAKGTVVLHLVALKNRQTKEFDLTVRNSQSGQTAEAETDSGSGNGYQYFNYHLNNTPKHPLNYHPEDGTSMDGTGVAGVTDKENPSPEASTYNPYGAAGNVGLSIYNPTPLNAPRITTALLPTAINMMRRYDEQRASGVTTSEMIERKVVGKRYLMSNHQEIYLADAYRFPKYQSTAIRIVWNNSTARPEYLDPQKIGLKIGRYIHIPTVYGQVRNVVWPGQNNELYLIYRIPNADIQQDYQLILPPATKTVRYAEPQTLPAE